ncbi:MAG: SUMF1/EgtB/PvdO family nonheme iron enzyme [bacterium]|nr:SUMF1/EgtB/PvdO family nonheme iron enzyme [bacterium]
MKHMLFAAAMTAVACSGVTVRDVQVSQHWPWSDKINVDYTLADVTEAVEVNVHAYSGGTDLGVVPDVALVGPRHAVKTAGTYRVTIDPSRCRFADYGVMENFRVAVSVDTSTLAHADETLYRIVDLTKPNTYVDVTRADILDRLYGDYETQPAWLDGSVNAVLGPANLFLTGITNDTTLVTDKLLLRKIKAGSYEIGTGTGTSDDFPIHTEVQTKDYWIGVFEITFDQWNRVTGGNLSNSYMTRPAGETTQVTYNTIRGKAAENADYDWPTGRKVDPNSFMGKLRTLTGLAFDLPTESRWAIAGYAGSKGTKYYNGLTCETLAQTLGRCSPNSSTSGFPMGGTALVGRYLPNGFGLYDMLGNAREIVLDWYASGNITAGATLTDWEGPVSGTYRGIKGGCAGQSVAGGMVLTQRSSSDITPEKSKGVDTGFRVCLVEE